MLDWIVNNKEWIFSGVGVVIVAAAVGVLVRWRKKKDKPTKQDFRIEGGSSNIQAGRDVHINHPEKLKKAGLLEITDVGFTHESEFDVKLRNLGDDACVITRIGVSMIRDHHTGVLPILNPTARYKIPIDGTKKGETRSLDVSPVVDAHKADRILIALDTTMVYTLKVTFHYNGDQTVSFKKRTW